MTTKPLPKTKAPIGDVLDPNSLYNHMRRFLAHMEEKHRSPETVSTREKHLRFFIHWCDERGITKPSEVDRKIIERYQRHLFTYRKADGEPLSAATQYLRLIPIGLWFAWMVKREVIPVNPAAEMELPKVPKRLPKAVFSAREAEMVLSIPDTTTVMGLRDRAILETFYSTAIRRAELIRLRIRDIDLERGMAFVFEGKGKKDRWVPIGERALAWINAYLDQARERLVRGVDDGSLFITNRGGALSVQRLTALVESYIKQADLGKTGSCHMFRHSTATLLLDGGMDIRYLQSMLGHAEITTTQIYTQVSQGRLKDQHTAMHPGKLPQPGQFPIIKDQQPA